MGRVETKFKETEIGLVPWDWEVKDLGEIGEVQMCRRIFNNQTSSEGAIPFYKIGTFGKTPDAYISQELYNEYRIKFSFPNKGDILISAAGTIGRTIVYNGEDSYFQDSNIVWIENNKNLISNELFYHILQIAKFNTEGGTIQRLYNSILKSKKIAIPPTKTEQTAIANALSDVDGYIESLEKLIDKKQKIKQGAMQQLFKPKKDWRLIRVEKIGNTFGGISGKSKSDFINGNSPYIPFMNVMKNVVIDTNFISYVKIGTKENQNKVLKGDLFFNGSSETPDELGMCSVLTKNISNLYLNSFCFGFRLSQDCKENNLYLSYFFRSDEGRKIFYSMAQGATRYNLSKEAFKKIEILVPDPTTQQQIAQTLTDMDSEITTLTKKLTKAKDLKQGMMQQLLTGKIRLL
jgi:type I restriction enzyme S subunit